MKYKKPKQEPVKKVPYKKLQAAFADFLAFPTWENHNKLVGQLFCDEPDAMKISVKEIQKEFKVPKAPWIPLPDFAWEIGDDNKGKNLKVYLEKMGSKAIKKVGNRNYVNPNKAWKELMESRTYRDQAEEGTLSYTPLNAPSCPVTKKKVKSGK